MQDKNDWPNIIVVDENDENPRATTFKDAWDNSLIRRGVGVFVVDDRCRVYLQKRSMNVSTNPGKWTLSATGGIDEGGTYKETAVQELQEELGLRDLELVQVGKFLHEVPATPVQKAWFTIYLAQYCGDDFQLNEEEVSEGKWFTFEEVDRLLAEYPEYVGSVLSSAWYLVDENYNVHTGEVFKRIMVVDEQGENPYFVPFFDAIRGSLIRKGTKIFLINKKSEVFLQCRSETMRHFPGRYDSSSGGHVEEGQTVEENAYEELETELGITGLSLIDCGQVFTNEGCDPPRLNNNQVYLAQYNADIETHLTHETAGGSWVSIQEVEKRLEENPDLFTPSAKACFEVVLRNYDQGAGQIFPNVIVTNENDENEQYVRFSYAVENGLNRRFSGIFVFDRENQKILLQKRSMHVGVCPGAWDYAAAGHVDEGETYESAAVRELAEEMGIKNVPLKEVGKMHHEYRNDAKDPNSRLLYAWATYFVAEYTDQEITYDQHEVEKVGWFTIEEIEAMLENDPTDFATHFILVWQKLKDAFIN